MNNVSTNINTISDPCAIQAYHLLKEKVHQLLLGGQIC